MSDYDKLKSLLREMGGVVIGYSGGVDSTFLAKAATEALGKQAVCVLIDSCQVPRVEVEQAVALAGEHGFNFMRLRANALSDNEVAENNPDRCYHCKKGEFSKMVGIAKERGIPYVLDGSNVDDNSDYRPGAQATAELGVRSPLKELGFTKARIREMSKEIGLPTWNQPSHACLASRIPYGTRLSAEVLGRIEKAEDLLRELGFGQFRVRHHGDIARIELMPDEMDRILTANTRECVVRELKSIGYKYIALDLAGYRVGSMNEILSTKQ